MSESRRTRRLYRSREDRMIAGVGGGLADYFDLDPAVARVLLFLVLLMTSGPFGIVIYAVLVWIIPEEPVGTSGADVDEAA